MATEGEVKSDYQAHSKGYSFFVNLMKWGTIAALTVAAIVILIISN